MTKLMSIEVVGKSGHAFSFNFYGNQKYIDEWLQEGFVITRIENVIPSWIVDLGLTKQFVFMQDLFNFKNPF